MKKESKDKKIICEFIGDEDISNYPEYKEKCLKDDQISKKINSKNYDNQDIRNNTLTKFFDKHLFRLVLTCELNNENNKTISIILMNPSYADYYGLDDTILNVKKFIEKINNKNNPDFKYSSFDVLNVFPIRIANSNCLPDLLKKYDFNRDYRNKNFEYIKTKIKQGCDYILAWGADYHKTEEAQNILKELNNNKNVRILVYHLNSSKGREGTPSHFTSRVYNKIKNNQGLKLIEVEINSKNDILFLESKKILLEI